MVLCNVSKRYQDGTVYVDISECNLTSKESSATSARQDNEDDGAMKFTIAVVIVYGIAAMGVLALGFLSRRKRNNETLDKEAGKFVKQYDDVKFAFDKKTRVGAVSALLQSIHTVPLDTRPLAPERQSAFKCSAYYPLPLANIGEENETDSSEDEDTEIVGDNRFMAKNRLTDKEDLQSSLSSILSNKENIDTDTSLSIEDLSSLKEEPESYKDVVYEKRMYRSLDDNKHKMLHIEKEKSVRGTESETKVRNNGASRHSNSDSHEDHDHLTLDDEVFVDESQCDDNYHDVQLYSYPPRDHSPDWVDISKEKFFTV